MRWRWNHHAPDNTQDSPPDNTGDWVRVQIARWVKSGPLIHAESAMEIAAWWHGPTNPGFTAFSHTGTITPELSDEIRRELTNAVRPESPHSDPPRAGVELLALLAYVREVTRIGGVLA